MAFGDLDLDGRPEIVAKTDRSLVAILRNIFAHSSDVNGDRMLNGQDVDVLCRAIANSETDSIFDIDQNQHVDRADLDAMLRGLSRVVGDVTLDGQFDSQDLVRVMIEGQYGRGPSDDVTWSTGDWNCDGVVDSGDLLFALERGNYVV